MNSYQKLKTQVEELKSKLLIVCTDPDSMKARLIKEQEKFKLNLEKSLWQGNAITEDKTNNQNK